MTISELIRTDAIQSYIDFLENSGFSASYIVVSMIEVSKEAYRMVNREMDLPFTEDEFAESVQNQMHLALRERMK